MRSEVICFRVLLKRGNRTKCQNYYRLQKSETFRKLAKTPRHFTYLSRTRNWKRTPISDRYDTSTVFSLAILTTCKDSTMQRRTLTRWKGNKKCERDPWLLAANEELSLSVCVCMCLSLLRVQIGASSPKLDRIAFVPLT